MKQKPPSSVIRCVTTAVTSLEEKIAALETANERLVRELADKQSIIDALLRRLYHPKTERFDPDQALLFERASASAAPALPPVAPEARPEANKPGHGRTPFPADLPRETLSTDVPAEERMCSTCGEALKLIGTDVCERGDIQPVKIIVRRWESRKYGCPQGHEVKTSEGAPRGLVERAKWTTESYAHVVVWKFADHMPLDRIGKMLKRNGIEAPASTLGSMVDTVAGILEPVVAQARSEILASDHLESDDTKLRVFWQPQEARPAARKVLKEGHLWVWKAGEKVLFDFDLSSGKAEPLRFLGEWTGTLTADGSKAYDAVTVANRIRRAGCWAHARRKYVEAADLKVAEALPMLVLLRRLYRIESAIKKRIKANGLLESDADQLRARVRDRWSRQMVARVSRELDRLKATVRPTPKSPLGKAIGYMEKQWGPLQVYLDDPRVPIDNNAVESAIRPIAIGRKNYLFAGSARGARNAATLYSVMSSCVAIGVNPYDYLVDVLDQVSPHADLARLTPWAWQAHRAATS